VATLTAPPPVDLTKPTHDEPTEPTEPVEAVDRPDNPLADWLTVPDIPVLPHWARSWQALGANTGALCRLGVWHAKYHGVRLPKYGAKTAWLASRGAFRASWRLWPVLSAHEHTKTVKALAAQHRAKPDDVALAVAHQDAHRVRTVARRWRFGAAALTAAAVVTTWSLADGWWKTLLGGTVLTLLTVLGWHEDARILDQAAPPLRLQMNAEHLNDALRAASLLKPGKGDDPGPNVTLVMGPLRDGNGWSVVFDLPRGGGKTASDVLAKREVLAHELGVDEIQLVMARVRAAQGGNAGRVSMWVADDDPYLAPPVPSPLVKLDTFSIWDPVPFGQDARGNRISVPVVWQSMFFGGLPRRGKTFTQRLLTAAGLLDPYVRHYVADFKGGQDWIQMRQVAHRMVVGAEDDAITAFKAMLKELLAEMERRFAILRGLPTSICPEGKLTPQIVMKYGLPFIFLTVDELQEAFLAMDDKEREDVVDDLARIARRGPAAGFISNYASQRPDAKSVPTKLREIITIRCCTQVTDKTSSDMVLGSGKAAMGADASLLSEDHVGVTVLVTGPASFATVKNDMLTTAEFNAMCAKGRALRKAAGQLSGDAVGDLSSLADEQQITIPPIVTDVLEVMRHSIRMFTTDLLAGLVNLDEDRYGDFDPERLASELEKAGVRRTSRQVKIDGENRAGYQRRDIEDAVPVELLAPRPVEPPASTDPAT
jgi:S-DNA-T family DNA segregation ATPase FtsK/SpoIIIE